MIRWLFCATEAPPIKFAKYTSIYYKFLCGVTLSCVTFNLTAAQNFLKIPENTCFLTTTKLISV